MGFKADEKRKPLAEESPASVVVDTLCFRIEFELYLEIGRCPIKSFFLAS